MRSRPDTSSAYCAAQFLGGFFIVAMLCTSCASGPPVLPYPAFIQVDELSDVFMASLPGVRAKQLAGDPQTRRTSNRVELPPDWKGTTGGAPGRSMEIFVLRGSVDVADISLSRGGYMYFPAGSLGFNLAAKDGAQILYFVNDDDPDAMIGSPIIIDSGVLDWQPGDSTGVESKELRNDPGNGSRTWLVRIRTGANLPWESRTAMLEGYLVEGNQQYSECINGEVETWSYMPGGYFLRPPNTISGGPDAVAYSDAIWLLREAESSEARRWNACTSVDSQL